MFYAADDPVQTTVVELCCLHWSDNTTVQWWVTVVCTSQTTQQWWITVGKPLSLTELD